MQIKYPSPRYQRRRMINQAVLAIAGIVALIGLLDLANSYSNSQSAAQVPDQTITLCDHHE